MAKMNPLTAATLESVNKLTMGDFSAALQNAIAAGREYAQNNPPSSDWYPCGFAKLNIKLRKNDKRSRILEDNGFRWDDYNKTWYLYGGNFTSSQSMFYKEDILNAVGKVLTDAGILCRTTTQTD